MDKGKPNKKPRKPHKENKSSHEKRRNSYIKNKTQEKSLTEDEEKTDNPSDSPKGINSIPGKENLNGAVALIIMPEVAEMVRNQEQKEGNPDMKDKTASRPASAQSVASSSLSLNQALAYSALRDENEELDLEATHESTALFQTCIPYLPVEIAVVCLVFNILIPGFGSLLCGISNFCCGKMQETVKKEDVPMKVFINLFVGVMQLLTVTFMLVGWFWSMAWGIKILLLSIENQKRIKKQKLLRDKRHKAKFAFTYADDDHENPYMPTLKY